MNGNLVSTRSSSELEKYVREGSAKGAAPWGVVHVLKCNLGLPDLFWGDVAGSLCPGNQ